ncbi:hypothetical protein Tco_0061269 [Tanacetum coccineum]
MSIGVRLLGVTKIVLLGLKGIPLTKIVLLGFKGIQYLFRYAEGRKQGAMMSGGQFVSCLTEHFGLLTEERLRGLTVVVHNLPMIDMDELVRLRVCDRLGDTWALVARGPERQQVAVARAAQADQEILDEGVQADPTPVHAPQAPSAAPGPRSMP